MRRRKFATQQRVSAAPPGAASRSGASRSEATIGVSASPPGAASRSKLPFRWRLAPALVGGKFATQQRGAVLIEAAFVLPIFFSMVFATAEYGLMYAAQSTVAQSARSGARYASANYAIAGNQVAAADATRDKVVNDLRARNRNDTPVELWIYKASSTGTPESGDFTTCSTRCLRYVWNGFTFGLVSGSWTDPDACGAGLDSVGVYLTMQHKYVTGVFGDQTTIAFHSAMRLEPLPLQQCPIGAT